ncbi:5'-nucleotidase C-terminal domain-containing protein [Geotoga petraea]|uniref:LysM domain-containing protein n=1 Tax=Geotoga petraea TaxID=28234 RepID=A0A1G6MXV9_9BACT|nr:5'-nucleotidase C-terminal domain-containing protein [Geotoga petraea]SDC60389.1 LysM domain-containing protein [Geotoga petraea]
MNKKNVLWMIFIVIILLITVFIFTLNGNQENLNLENSQENGNTAETIFEDDYNPENEATTDISTQSTIIDKLKFTENSTITTDLVNEATTDSSMQSKVDKQEPTENSTKITDVSDENVFLNMYFTSNIKGDFTTYDYEYDKKDYDGSFSQLAKLIEEQVEEEDILINLGDTFSKNSDKEMVNAIFESFEDLNYDLWITSKNDFNVIKGFDLKLDLLLTPHATKSFKNIVFGNEVEEIISSEDIQILVERFEDKNRFIINNKYTDSSREFIINNSSETLFNIYYNIKKDEATINKIPVKNDDRVILPLHRIEEIFIQYHENSLESLTKIIGEVVNQDFFYEKGLDQIDSYWLKPTKITDFINEVQLYYANQIFEKEIKISSTPIYTENLEINNEISKRYINKFYPKKNTLYIVEMTGKQLKDYLEWSVEFYDTYKKEHLTITRSSKDHELYDIFKGINYRIDISKEYGNRIVDLTDYGSNTIYDQEKYLLVTNSERAENEFSKNGEIFTEELPKVVLSSKDVEKYKNYYIPDFIEDYIINVKNGILKEFPDQNWEIIGTNWNKIHRIKAEKIFNDGSLTIDNTVPLTYNDIKDMAEQITLKYSVESGDWLLKISRIYGVDYKSIAEKNNIENPDLIFPNQVFVIPEN